MARSTAVGISLPLRGLAAGLLALGLAACGGPARNAPPVAAFSVPGNPHERAEYVLDGTLSSDPDGRVVSHGWSMALDGPQGADVALSSVGETAVLSVGELAADVRAVVSLRVADSYGAASEAAHALTLRELDSDRLPPKPESPGQGLFGVDADRDRVRDDIEIAILEANPLSQRNRQLLRHAAAVYSRMVAAGATADARDDGPAMQGLAAMASCIDAHGESGVRDGLAAVRALSFDTPARAGALRRLLLGGNAAARPAAAAGLEQCALPQDAVTE